MTEQPKSVGSYQPITEKDLCVVAYCVGEKYQPHLMVAIHGRVYAMNPQDARSLRLALIIGATNAEHTARVARTFEGMMSLQEINQLVAAINKQAVGEEPQPEEEGPE